MTWFEFVLFLHIFLAIVAFGPTFAFPLIGAAGGKEPAHARFAVQVTKLISKRMTVPLAVVIPFTGVWLIYQRDWDLWQSEWLVISIVLYTAAFVFANFIQTPRVGRLIDAMQRMEGAPAAGPSPAASAGQGGPPPEIAGLLKKIQLGGAYLALTILTITLLMVWKPGGTFTGT